VTIAGAVPAVLSWTEPEGVAPRGTLVVVPGRGEHAGVYERFGHRISADGYRVHAVPDPTVDEEQAVEQVRAALDGPGPHVLVGSDAGALVAAGLVASGEVEVAGLVLAGFPTAAVADRHWEDEVAARTACPTHRARLSGDDALRRGALADRLPGEWFAHAVAQDVPVPVLGLHGTADTISPLAAVRDWYGDLPVAELVTIAGGRHDALNDQTHRTAAATIVLFLERLRLGPDLPAIARVEEMVGR
jgi:alpha-beta hydrolase superfamily lysophospholipase